MKISNKYQLIKKLFGIGYWKLVIGNSRIKHEQGFTLVELLIYIGIFVILLSVFIQLFSSLVATQLESQSTSSVSEDSKYLLARLSYDINRSQNILSPNLGVSSSSAQLIVNNTTYTYALSNNNLILTNSDGSMQLNSSDTSISNLSFTPVSSSSGKFTIEISFIVIGKASNGGHLETQSMQTSIGNR